MSLYFENYTRYGHNGRRIIMKSYAIYRMVLF